MFLITEDALKIMRKQTEETWGKVQQGSVVRFVGSRSEHVLQEQKDKDFWRACCLSTGEECLVAVGAPIEVVKI